MAQPREILRKSGHKMFRRERGKKKTSLANFLDEISRWVYPLRPRGAGAQREPPKPAGATRQGIEIRGTARRRKFPRKRDSVIGGSTTRAGGRAGTELESSPRRINWSGGGGDEASASLAVAGGHLSSPPRGGGGAADSERGYSEHKHNRMGEVYL